MSRWLQRQRAALRAEEARSAVAATAERVPGWDVWHEVVPGQPLGVGMPSGEVLREDGESHSEWWGRVLRADPCAYCGAAGGTVDHVVPKATGRPLVHRWTNLVGACERCNGSKSDKPLLLWLRTRPRRLVDGERDGERDVHGGVDAGERQGVAVAHGPVIGARRAA